MEGQTLFYKTLLAETEGPIRENISQLISELYDSLLFYDSLNSNFETIQILLTLYTYKLITT